MKKYSKLPSAAVVIGALSVLNNWAQESKQEVTQDVSLCKMPVGNMEVHP